MMISEVQARALRFFKSHYLYPPKVRRLVKSERRTFNAKTMRVLCESGYLGCEGAYPGATGARYRITTAGQNALREYDARQSE